MTSFAEIGAANLLGIVIYLASALVAIVAARRAEKSGPDARAIWIAVCCVFLGLALFRISGSEETLRQWLRNSLFNDETYQSRGAVQIGALVTCLAGAIYLVACVLPHVARRPQWQMLLAGSAGWLALLYCLRIISLHGVDSILYTSIGQLHFNHLLELLPIIAAWYAAWISISRTASKA